jgi:hypothetical protein
MGGVALYGRRNRDDAPFKQAKRLEANVKKG